MSAVARPDARSGTTRRPNSCTSAAFSSGGRDRSVVPRIRARRLIRSRRTMVASSPGFPATTTRRPPRASDSMLPAMCTAPTSSRMTSAPPSSRTRAKASSADIASAPSSATRGRSFSERTLATTRAPIAAPICTAAVPTPPLPPFTSSTSPAARPACSIASKAVRNACGVAAAVRASSASGTFTSSRSEASTRSAIPPPPTSPNARSPTANEVTPAPTATTGPATSRPGTSAGHPGGGGCLPSRWSTSAGFTPAKGGAITTSNRPGAGSGRSSIATISRPPTPR